MRSFATFTEDLHALHDWFRRCQITTVAMESTGVFWIPLFQILEAAGIKICLANEHRCKNLPGRKTDLQDCQWIQHLHSVGLLRGSFRPAGQVCAVRAIPRHRDALVRGGGSGAVGVENWPGPLEAGLPLTAGKSLRREPQGCSAAGQKAPLGW